MSKELALTIDNVLAESAGKFATTLTQYQWNLLPDTQLQAAKQALTKNDYIMKIAANDLGAVHDSLMNSAILGLDLTEGKRQGWLVPRKNQQGKTVVTLQVGYKGVEAIHQRMGVIDRLVIRTVRQDDDFSWSGDDQEKPTHTADWFDPKREHKPIKGAYAITYYPDKSINVCVTSITEIYEKHRDRSDSYRSYIAKKAKGENAYPPPWVSDEKAMVEKTMAYVASKQWPANIRDQETSSKILETLHQIDVSDYSIYTPEQKEIFDSLIANEDSLGLYLFNQKVDIEIQVALFNSFPKGEKTAKKQKVRYLEGIGANQLQNVTEGLSSGDNGLVLENLEGAQNITIRALMSTLDAVQRETLNNILKEAE